MALTSNVLELPGRPPTPKEVDPHVDVIPGVYPWSGAYDNLSSLPSPVEIASTPWYLPEQLKLFMLRDPQIFAGYMLWKTGVLVDGFQIYTSKTVNKSHRRYKRAREIAEMCLYACDSMTGGFHNKLLQLLDCCIHGYKIGKLIYRDEKGSEYKGKLIWDDLSIKGNDTFRLRQDKFQKIQAVQPINDTGNKNLYSIKDFMMLTFRPYDQHPLGTNLFWPCYSPWYEKIQIAPERLANMAQFGSMSLVATAPEGVKDIEVLGPDGLPLKYPATLSDGVTPHPYAGQPKKIPINTHMLSALRNFQGNGSVTVLPFSAVLDKLEAANSGDTFRFYTDDTNMAITKAMFFTTGWTEQERYGSNSKAKTQALIGRNAIMDGKWMLAHAIRNGPFRDMVEANYGEEDTDLIPHVVLGSFEQGMMASIYNAISALWSTRFFNDADKDNLKREMGLPEPDPEMEEIAKKEMEKLGDPVGSVGVNTNPKPRNDEDDDD